MDVRTLSTQIRFRIIVRDPPPGVPFAVQVGRTELLAPIDKGANALQFEFDLRVQPGPDGHPNFLGPCAQGPREQRFVYVTSGVRAGSTDSCWDRRAKLSLMSIDWALLEAYANNPRSVLEGLIHGRARDGGPACASVPILGGWQRR